MDYMENEHAGDPARKQNCVSVSELTDEVLEVLNYQCGQGQVLKITEPEATRQYQDLVVASPGAIRKNKWVSRDRRGPA